MNKHPFHVEFLLGEGFFPNVPCYVTYCLSSVTQLGQTWNYFSCEETFQVLQVLLTYQVIKYALFFRRLVLWDTRLFTNCIMKVYRGADI
jgi:hypothetical protein